MNGMESDPAPSQTGLSPKIAWHCIALVYIFTEHAHDIGISSVSHPRASDSKCCQCVYFHRTLSFFPFSVHFLFILYIKQSSEKMKCKIKEGFHKRAELYIWNNETSQAGKKNTNQKIIQKNKINKYIKWKHIIQNKQKFQPTQYAPFPPPP